MAANLDRNTRTGVATIFSVKQTPWHREGTVLTGAPTFEDALELAGHNFDVELRPLYMPTCSDPLLAQDFMASPTGRAVVRTDRWPNRESVLAIVGDDYTPVQNRDALAVLEPLVDKGLATLETGGTLRGGRDVWMQVAFNITDARVREVFGSEVVPFGTISNNHSGQRGARVMNTPVRIVCANTLRAAMGSNVGITVRHRGDARVRLIDAATELWAGIVERHVALAEQFAAMKSTILTVDAFIASVLDVAAPLPKKPEDGDLTSWERSVARVEKKRDAIEAAWEGGDGHTGDHSAWEAYNGLVQVLDHDDATFWTRGSRVSSLTDGALGQTKEAVYATLLKLAK